MKILNCNLFLSIFSLSWVSCLVFSLKSLFLIFVCFLILSYVFCSTSLFFGCKLKKKHQFLVKRGVATKRFFMNLCFAKCEKLSFFGGHFFANLWLLFKKHSKIGILAHFSKQNITKRRTFLEVISWSKLEVLVWSKLGAFKKRQLGPDNNFQLFLRRNCFFQRMCWNHYFYSVVWQSVF